MQSIRSGAKLRSTLLRLFVICLTLGLCAQQHVASAQATTGTAIALNVSGTLASAGASQASILSLFQNIVVLAGHGPTSTATSLGLGSFTFPDYLVNAAGIADLAQVRCLIFCEPDGARRVRVGLELERRRSASFSCMPALTLRTSSSIAPQESTLRLPFIV